MSLPAPATAILAYWFGAILDGGGMTAAHRRRWFGKDPTTDREIAERFAVWLEPGRQGELHWEGPRGLLASVVLLDQFPRNIFRGRPEAFSYDPAALSVAERALDTEADLRVGPLERVFFYLPFEHAEELSLQERSVCLFRDLVTGAPADQRQVFVGFLDYAIRHRDIIARFGRFPHRNGILGRPATAEETAFLHQPGSSF